MSSVQHRPTPVENGPTIVNAIPAGTEVDGIAPESAFTIRPELCSELTQNRVRLHPGTAFTIDRIPTT